MTEPVQYQAADGVAVITIDDGKANALTPEVFAGIHAGLDQAAADDLAVVLAGRPSRFSAGFHLATLTSGTAAGPDLLESGFLLSHRLLGHPAPVVIACTGHAYAMGAFLLLSGDHRIGTAGTEFRVTANEVAIGMTMPRAAIEICRQRLTPAGFERAVVLAEVFSHEEAVAAGWLDELVPADDVVSAAVAKATALAGLNRRAHVETKLRCRADTLAAIKAASDVDVAEFRTVSGG